MVRQLIETFVHWLGWHHHWVDTGERQLDLGADLSKGPLWYCVEVCTGCDRERAGDYDYDYTYTSVTWTLGDD